MEGEDMERRGEEKRALVCVFMSVCVCVCLSVFMCVCVLFTSSVIIFTIYCTYIHTFVNIFMHLNTYLLICFLFSHSITFSCLPSYSHILLHYFILHISGLVRNLLPRAAMNLETPIMAPLWSSSLSFSKCHAERKVMSVCVCMCVFVCLSVCLIVCLFV